jgi:hypothetical protein
LGFGAEVTNLVLVEVVQTKLITTRSPDGIGKVLVAGCCDDMTVGIPELTTAVWLKDDTARMALRIMEHPKDWGERDRASGIEGDITSQMEPRARVIAVQIAASVLEEVRPPTSIATSPSNVTP